MFDLLREWQGSAEDLSDVLSQQIQQLQLSVEVPAIRTVRLWRSKEIFSQAKKQPFRFRQILEGLATAILLKKGWTLSAIAEILPSFRGEVLENQIIAESQNQDPSWTLAFQTTSVALSAGHQSNLDSATDAVVLLAQGIELLYRRLQAGREIIRQDDSLSAELYRAMCKLGRLYIEQGLPDKCACVHTVLHQARYPFKKWELEIFHQEKFPYGDAILIDPNLRVPTSDCSQIALSRDGFGEDNVVERRLYNELVQMTEALGSRRRHRAYTSIRMLFGKYSLIGERQLLNYLEEHDLIPLQENIIEKFFDPVPEAWLINGKANRCADCGTLLHPHFKSKEGRCPIRQCRGNLQGKATEKLDFYVDRPLIAKPQILTFWTAPAIDELAIYETAKQLGLNAELYPESDQCDIAINERAIGIDAKSYNSLVSLAMRLNRSIGGLLSYRRRIIAVSDWLIEDNPYYIDTLKSTLEKKGHTTTLEILSISDVIKLLKTI